MPVKLDRQSVERLRSMPPARALAWARHAVYASDTVGSEDFLDLYEQLVEEEVLTWDQIDRRDR